MTREKEQQVNLLLNRHAHTIQRSLIEHLTKVIPVPALRKAARSWPRKEVEESLEATIAKIMDVMYEPVIATRLVSDVGKHVRLVGLSEAAPLVSTSARVLHDLSLVHDYFPMPVAVTSVGRLWVLDDIESFCRAHRPSDGWKVPRVAGKAKAKP